MGHCVMQSGVGGSSLVGSVATFSHLDLSATLLFLLSCHEGKPISGACVEALRKLHRPDT